MKKLLFSILIILLCLTSFMLVSCDGEEDTTTVKPPEFSITYELNGGINSVDNPLTYTKGEIVTLNNPTKENYYFKGWYTDAAFTNKITEIKDKSENITLYAKWTPVVTYNLSYELNGGTNNTENPKTYKTGDTVSLAFPERADYMFAGWYTDSALTSEIKEIKDKEESLTLYAKWIPYDDVFEFYQGDISFRVGIRPYYYIETIIIPSEYKGLPVTKITGIGRYSYNMFKTVFISESVTEIPLTAFTSAVTSEYVEISLEYISVDPNNPKFKSVDGVLYSKDGKTLFNYPANKRGDSFTIPDGVTSINNFAFTRSVNLKSITISDSVTTIGRCSFMYCTALEEIVIPKGVTILNDNTFKECTSLKRVTLSSGVHTIYSNAFEKCISLESINIPNSVKTIGNWAFSDCYSLKSIVIPSSVTTIKEVAFRNCPSLTAYCEAETKPEGWNDKWFSYGTENVVWGYNEGNK